MEEENATQVLDNNDALNENYEALRWCTIMENEKKLEDLLNLRWK
jgi:hypothetical protein